MYIVLSTVPVFRGVGVQRKEARDLARSLEAPLSNR